MRSFQLLALALLATAARADTVPFFNYFYSCSSGVEDCTHFQHHTEGPVRTFDITAQPANGFYLTDIAPYLLPGPISWEQITSNHQGEALGFLDVGGSRTSFAAVLMGPAGEIFPVYGFARDINENGIVLSGGIDGPFLDDASSTEASGGVNPRMLADIISAAIKADIFNNFITTFVDIEAMNDYNQVIVDGGIAPRGILSPFAVPEPSTLLLLTTGLVVLAWRFRWAGFAPTFRMNPLQVVVLLILGILLPRSAQADAVTFITTTGADFQGDLRTPVAALSGGMSLAGFSDSGGHFVFSNPLAPVVGLAAHEGVGTGSLVAQADTSWTFHGGSVVAESDGEGASIIPVPPGYATCEAAGFTTFLIGTGMCLVAGPALSGTLTGDVLLSLSNVTPDTSGGFSASFDLTGPVTFGITPGLALAGGVIAGPYFGSLTVEGSYFQDISLGGQAEYQMVYGLFEVSGATVPEPSTLIFLLTAVLCIYVLLGRRHLHKGKPSL